MRTLVTGAAGFIGSTLSEELLKGGHDVLGVDSFTDYYDPQVKRANTRRLHDWAGFRLVDTDLRDGNLDELFGGIDVVFHLAGQPGVRSSWRGGFQEYVDANVLATQRVLEAAARNQVGRVVYASSSSVYGNAARYPCEERDVPRPFSPYGVTKLAGEHLAVLYAENFGLPTVSLRYFTVFGPRQRPEMGIAKVIDAALTGAPFPLFAAAGAVRDFTYVADVVDATIRAGLCPGLPAGLVLNVAGGAPAAVDAVIASVEELAGRPVILARQPTAAGDVMRTGGDTARAQKLLGWRPRVGLREGLEQQIAWQVSNRSEGALPQQRAAAARSSANVTIVKTPAEAE